MNRKRLLKNNSTAFFGTKIQNKMKVYDIKNARKNTDSCVSINITYKTGDIIHKNTRKRIIVKMCTY